MMKMFAFTLLQFFFLVLISINQSESCKSRSDTKPIEADVQKVEEVGQITEKAEKRNLHVAQYSSDEPHRRWAQFTLITKDGSSMNNCIFTSPHW